MTPVSAVSLNDQTPPRFAASPVLDELLPSLTGLNLPFSVAERLDARDNALIDELFAALNGQED